MRFVAITRRDAWRSDPSDPRNFVDLGDYGPKDFPDGDVEAAIRWLVRDSGMNPRQINFGNCDQFAERMVDTVGGTLMATSDESNLPAHYFLLRKGRCHDAEAPQGVAGPSDLPIYQRFSAARKH